MSSLWFETALIGDRWADRVRLDITDGVISAIMTGMDPAPVDERHAIGLPGLPNLHSHAFQRGMAGLTEQRGATGDDFWSWRDLMYRFLDRLGPEDVEAIAALAYVEMLEAGFTRVGEFHYLHHDPDGRPYAAPAEMASRIVAAAETSGIALTLLPVFYAHGGFGGVAPGAAQRRFLHDVDSYKRVLEESRKAVSVLPDAVTGIAPHSLRAATPEEIRAILPLADGGPIHMHIAEQRKEVADCLAWSGRRPVEWLFDEMPVDRRWCLVHATHVIEAERQALAQSGAVAGLCPVTEANLGDGIFPARTYLDDGGSFGIGSDSNVLIGAGEELRLLEYGQRLIRTERCTLASPDRRSVGGTLFTGALAGGARALGVQGGIAIGQAADLVSLDANDPALIARRGDALLDSWIFASRAGIDCVWRRGVRLVEGGRHGRRDEVRRRYAAVLARLLG
ncbi:MAG: formimidoylglutamate deiminase [Sphingomonas bacterium]|uniref:formimidoylglutamate deiminase n=1 Tax=Sphingomonas bacterium TaxID=1895847 RepID=UPI0026104E25|nr:formimidoylglutamate deiminase [Sphingomonas bacterium]MDB5707197.1 formimidoylglutamate deiminase [Sphingomonas bacterium]